MLYSTWSSMDFQEKLNDFNLVLSIFFVFFFFVNRTLEINVYIQNKEITH